MGQASGGESAKNRTSSVDELLALFEAALAARDIRSRDSYLSSVKAFMTYLAADGIDPLGISPVDAQRYRSFLVGEGTERARGTVNNLLGKVRLFYRILEKRGLVLTNPFRAVGGLRVGRILPKTVLTVTEMGALLSGFGSLRPMDLLAKSVIEFLYGSGIRIGEAQSLKLDDVDEEGRTITITESKLGFRRRIVPATEASLRSFRDYRQHARSLLIAAKDDESGFAYPQGSVCRLRVRLNAILERECKRLGLPVVTTHCFRHSCATHLLKSGAGIRQVQAFLGHEKITSTEVYTHLALDDVKKELLAYHPRERAAIVADVYDAAEEP